MVSIYDAVENHFGWVFCFFVFSRYMSNLGANRGD